MRWSSWREELSRNGSDEQAGLRQIWRAKLPLGRSRFGCGTPTGTVHRTLNQWLLGIGSLCHDNRDSLGRSSPLWTCSESYSTIWITMSDNGLNLVFSS